ncbi:DUF3592 domain-containing protein [Caenimonas sedimenti]|uniref:DUF3592 domain-containing protein n=1 Tax=Caenimonas sedimenti TaxID=2596921 RepID=A0A562ZY69_9BURK|nr:DUF3592 domain-containing protein [Caenimonas sedimenti]TWO73341.1 DUF3592 domain-containing protein [Caenimonas sedimenti]
MALRLTSHLYARVGASFVGFFGGGTVFTLLFFGKTDSPIYLVPFWFFGLILGGTYLAQLAFSLAFPAACPECRAAAARPTLRKPTLYVCRSCGAATDSARAMMIRQLAMLRLGTQQDEGESFLAWVFVFVGIGTLALGIWLAQDEIHLARNGTSTEAIVLRVEQKSSRDQKGKPETRHTAVVQYHVDEVRYTLTRGWSVPDTGGCMWPCYHQGEPLKVIYLPGAPGRAKIHSPAELFGVAGMFSGAGLLFAGIGVLIIRHQRQRPPQRESWKEMRDLIAEIRPPAAGASRGSARTPRDDK